jgi:ATP-dependent helicase/DNAse subunit B
MLLLTGAAGSGKTSRVLDSFRAALSRREASVRLLAPTATMARHLQNRIAREGLVPRPSLVQTLSRFAEPWAERAQVSEAHLYLIVEAAARRTRRAEFARVLHMPGFSAALARTIEEFSSAGCDSRRLARNLPSTPLAEAFLAIYEDADRELARRDLAMRAARLEQVAARIRAEGMPGIATIWLDGFHALPDPELALIEAMARHADVTVTLPAAPATDRTRAKLLGLGFHAEMLEGRRPQPAVEVVEAPVIERETDEIARRILDYAAARRAFREIGIILRNADLYEPILRATLERFGIPARFYFDSQLATHGVTRWVLDQVALAPWPPREQRAADDWAASILALLASYERPKPGDRTSRAMAMLWREQNAALAGVRGAIEQSAAWFGANRTVAFAEFWAAAKAILRLSQLRVDDERRNVVQVLSAYEARQWELPVVFVCGLVEKQFPRYFPQDAFFPDGARRQLQAAGIRVRTTTDAELEEEALFESAVACARESLILTYPKFDGRGEENLRSAYLERFPQPPRASRLVRPRRERLPAAALGPGIIAAHDLRDAVARKHRVLRVTAVESFLQCPFQFFGRHTLALEEPELRPEERLSFRVQGNIVHAVIAEWQRASQPHPIAPLFERIFTETCRKEKIPPGYRTESLRAQMLRDLERFAADPSHPIGAGTEVELPVQFDLDGDVSLRGRIDRLDRKPDGTADVIDYKYSKKASDYAKSTDRLQGPLYLLAVQKALGLEPGGMTYCGLRGAVQYVEQPVSRERREAAVETTLRVIGEVRAGNAAPRPADLAPCRFCTFKDVCRYQAAEAALAITEGA